MTPEERAQAVFDEWSYQVVRVKDLEDIISLIAQALREHGNEKLEALAHELEDELPNHAIFDEFQNKYYAGIAWAIDKADALKDTDKPPADQTKEQDE